MGGSAHAGEKVQQGALMALHQLPKGGFAACAHPRHQGEVVGFRLDGIGHEQAFLASLPKKEKPFAQGRGAEFPAREKSEPLAKNRRLYAKQDGFPKGWTP